MSKIIKVVYNSKQNVIIYYKWEGSFFWGAFQYCVLLVIFSTRLHFLEQISKDVKNLRKILTGFEYEESNCTRKVRN